MPGPSIIAIDGPAAVGKSTIGNELARRLGYLFVDTGALFRVVAWTALGQGVDLRDHEAVAEIAERINTQLAPPTREGQYRNTVYADGKDVTEEIYQPLIDANVALVGANPLARKALTRHMRQMAAQGRVIMIGRDIGTEVLPDADLKIWLEASVEERAGRRFQELVQQGQKVRYQDILGDMKWRDNLDIIREVAPMLPAADAVIIHTDGLSIEAVLDEVMKLIIHH